MDMLLKKQSLAISLIGALSLFSFSVYGDKGGNTNTGGGMDSEASVMRSMSIISDVQTGFITDTDLQVHFNEDFGVVSIHIRDVNGFVVFTRSFDTSIGNETTISTWGWAAGSYRMTIVNIENQIIHNENFMVH